MLLTFWFSSNLSLLKELYIYNLVLIDSFNLTQISNFFLENLGVTSYRKQMLLRSH